MEAEPPPPSKRPAKLKIGTVGAAEVVVAASEVDATGRRKTGVEQDEQLIFFLIKFFF